MHNPVDTSPLVAVFSLPPYHTKALKNIDYVVNPSPLDTELPRALIKQEEILLFFTVDAEKPAAKLPQ